jgi:lysophospholipase L1-like esterase
MRHLLLIAILAAPLGAQTNPAFREVADDPALPRVLLIGDSISIGYTVPTQKILTGKANVHRIGENGGPTTRGLERIDGWLGDGKWDLIHVNFGLHDLKRTGDGLHLVPISEYESNLARLIARLSKTGAKLIWASTTAVPDADLSPPRKDADVVAYNQAAARVMKKHGVPTNDLYAFTKPILSEIQRPANVHFTDAGSQRLAEQVAAAIRKELGR